MKPRTKPGRRQPPAAGRKATPATVAVTPQPDALRSLAAAALLVVATLVTYALLYRAGFIWDDDSYVETNTTLRSIDGLRRMWLDTSALRQYYPLVHTTFWVEYHLWGLAPLGFHMVNVLLHATSAVLLWRLLGRWGVPGGWLAALIFAVHPVEVESVAWVTERKNVLSLALALGSMLAYLRFAPVAEDEPGHSPSSARWRWYALAMFLFAGALLSKTVVASLPAVLLVMYWWRRGRIAQRDVVPLLPFFLLGVGLGLLTVTLERENVGAVGREWDFSPFERLLIAGRAVWFYAAKLAWPDPLVFIYPRWSVSAREWWQYTFPVAAVALIASLWLSRARIGRGPLAAVLIFCGVLVPALGFFNVYPFRYSFVADHFQYHASVALFALAAAGITRGADRLPHIGRQAAYVAVGAAVVLLAALSIRQTQFYRGLEPLYRDTIAKNPTGWMAYSNLGVVAESQGRLEEAYQLFSDAVRLKPEDATLQNNMGHILLSLGERDGFKPGQIDTMTQYFRHALQLNPKSIPAGRGMGFALYHAKRYNEAIDQFARTLNLERGDPYSLCGMGAVYCAAGKLQEADECFHRALQGNGMAEEAYRGLSMVRVAQGRPEEAIGFLRDTVRVQPTHVEAHFELGNLLAQKKDFRRARDEFQLVVKLRPTYVEAWNRLGIANGEIGEVDEAIASFREMSRLDPASSAARVNLEKALELKQKQGPSR